MIPAILGGGLLLLWPALLNGYPLVFIDTHAYLAQTIVPRMAWDKPWVYGPFLHLGHWQLTLWCAASLQVLLLSWLLWIVQRVALGQVTPMRHLLLVLLLAALTSLPWFAATLMPDVFAGALVLCLWLLGFGEGRLSRRETAAVAMMGAFATAAHLSHLVIAAAMLAITLLLTRRWRATFRVAVPVAVALAFLIVSNGIGHGRFSLSPYGATFALARMQADGPATALLRARCPAAGWYLCDFLDQLPMDSDEFLWSPGSPISRDAQGNSRVMGTVLIAPEARQIVAATLAADPGAVFAHALRNTLRQLVTLRVGDTLTADHLETSARVSIVDGFPPREVAAFDTALQMRGRLPEVVQPLLWPHGPVLLISVLLAGWSSWRLRGPSAYSLLICVLTGLLANALVTGSLSKPHHRYQARIVWLLPLAAGIAGVAAWHKRCP